MSRRTTPQKKTDERAFPVRVRFEVPGNGLGLRLGDLHRWLNREIGAGFFAVHSSPGLGTDALAVYLCDAEGARELVTAFPDFQLADGTQSPSYYSPAHATSFEALDVFGVCNLFSLLKGQDAIRELVKIWDDQTGNLPPLPGIYPNYLAPVISNSPDGRVLSMMRWGMPSPAFALKGKKTDRGVTNVRNTRSPHWRRWLGVQHRCVVPFTAFAEPHKQLNQDTENVWFALNEDRPLAFFAGIWTEWTSVRKLSEGETTDNLFGFLTTDANGLVGPIHPKAMPVVLTTETEIDTWLTAEPAEAMQLQRPAPDELLQIVARGGAEDSG